MGVMRRRREGSPGDWRECRLPIKLKRRAVLIGESKRYPCPWDASFAAMLERAHVAVKDIPAALARLVKGPGCKDGLMISRLGLGWVGTLSRA
jgi:hypothetical protein